MLSFDPFTRISVTDALAHPWLAAYHDVNDEPECPQIFEKWSEYEQLETLEQYREALWNEIEDYRKEVRGIGPEVEIDYFGRSVRISSADGSRKRSTDSKELPDPPEIKGIPVDVNTETEFNIEQVADAGTDTTTNAETTPSMVESRDSIATLAAPLPAIPEQPVTPTDPLIQYARRSSMMGPSRQASTYSSPLVSTHQQLPSYTEGPAHAEPGSVHGTGGGIAFPTYGRTESYIVPARSRTASMAGGEVSRKLLRTLSTVSIHESIDGLPGGLAGVAEIGKYITGNHATEADAPPSEIPGDFRIDEGDEEEEDQELSAEQHGRKDAGAAKDTTSAKTKHIFGWLE